MKSILKGLLVIIAPIILWSCAGPLPDVVWPLPPDPPRIKYVTSYHRGGDVSPTSIATEIILGAETAFTIRKPSGIHVDKDGRLFITDTAKADVFVFDPEKGKATSVTSEGVRGFFKPIGVATDSKGRVFITDSQADRVTVLDSEYKLLGYLETQAPFNQPTGIAVDEANNRLYVVDTHNHHVQAFALDTLEFEKIIGGRSKEEGGFNFPSHITVDNEGALYVTDTMNARIQIFDKEGRFLRSFGQFGDVPGMFARPKGVEVDSEGHIYVVDAAFNNVQIFNQEGVPLLHFGGYGSDRGQMILPSGIAINDEDYIYVVDSWNERVNVYEFLGEKHKAREAKGGGS